MAVTVVPPGSRTALSLSGVAARDHKSTDKAIVGRGDILTLPELGTSAIAIDVVISKSQLTW